jgi:hypothetical protein
MVPKWWAHHATYARYSEWAILYPIKPPTPSGVMMATLFIMPRSNYLMQLGKNQNSPELLT